MSFCYNLFTFTVSAVNATYPAVINLSKYSTPFIPFYCILCHRRLSSCFWVDRRELVPNKEFSEWIQQTHATRFLERSSIVYNGMILKPPIEILFPSASKVENYLSHMINRCIFFFKGMGLEGSNSLLLNWKVKFISSVKCSDLI